MVIHLNDYNPYKDLLHDDAPLINEVISKMNKRDTLVIDSGEYLCSTIFLKSDISINLEKGARIKMINNIDALYDIKRARDTSINAPIYAGCDYDGKPSKYFIYGENIENFALYGMGVIDGNEEIFYGSVTPHYIEGTFYPRVPLIYIENGKNLTFYNITLTKSAFWTLHLVGCDNVVVDSIKIKNNPIMVNCDGIDPDHSKNVVIKNCDISCADDCIVIKNTEAAQKYGDTYNIHVENCRLKSTSSAIKIGTETYGSFYELTFERIKIYDTNRGISIMNRDGADIHNLRFSHIDIENHLVSPIHWWGRSEVIYITNIKRNEKSNLGKIDNIIFDDITARSENGIVIYGDNISNITIDKLSLNRHKMTAWESKDIDLRPSVYNVIDGSFHDFYSKGCRDVRIMNTNLKDVVWED